MFQALQHTVQMPAAQWRVLSEAHDKRNRIEYEGRIEIEPKMLEALLRVVTELARLVGALGPVK